MLRVDPSFDRVARDLARAVFFVETRGQQKLDHTAWARYARRWFENTERLPVRTRDDSVFFYQARAVRLPRSG